MLHIFAIYENDRYTMIFRNIGILLFQVLFSVSTFSQIDSTLKDTNKEITIYEYDTVYLQSDTIRLTNIILDSTKKQPIKENKTHPFSSALIPNSIGINISPYISGSLANKTIYDSLVSLPVINESFFVQINYNIKKYSFSFGTGFTRFHEKYHLQGPNLISRDYSDNYNYLNISLLFGRKLNINNKLYIIINAGCITDFLIGHKQAKTDISAAFIRKTDISIAITPYLAYKLSRNLEFYLSPFYHRSLFIYKKYPFTSYQKMGIGVGFNIVL